ncbi:hypothetical protein Tsp_04527 [Trichinella spiralis]|uniref:hypothetical protein n=1 Tax=Trichinella spiralis TaxID=6334 RepID=UPI0001EFEEDD|nr:hypothetical protein Tsp_04527 [Trichinella spiralis]
MKTSFPQQFGRFFRDSPCACDAVATDDQIVDGHVGEQVAECCSAFSLASKLGRSILGSTGISLGASSLQVLTTRTCRRLCPLRGERLPGTFSECPLFRSSIQQVVQGNVPKPCGPFENNSALDFTGAPLLIHGMMRQVPGTSQRSSIRSFHRPTVV